MWVVLVTAEGLGYAHLPVRRGIRRSLIIGTLLVLLLASLLLRPGEGEITWVVFSLLGVYRMVNLARFWVARLPAPRLSSVCLRAHVWLVVMQALVLAVGTAITRYHLARLTLDVTVVTQVMTAVVLVRATEHTWRHSTAPRDVPPIATRDLPTVSVLVPTRNESERLRQCLEALVASDYPKLEIIVLDDHSSDKRTPETIRGFAEKGIRFVSGRQPDESRWLAKNYALHQLADEASGDILLFCSADTQLQAHTIRRLVEVLEVRRKSMLSVLPMRLSEIRGGSSIFPAMRYFWELCLPRRFFKRPPVVTACWMIRRSAFDKMGGLTGASNAVNPVASLARQAVTTDSYSFLHSDDDIGVYTAKPSQYEASVRVRYPQLHRRLELTVLTVLAELMFMLGPIIGLCLAPSLRHPVEFALVCGVAVAGLFVTYSFAAVATRVASPWYGWLLMPVAFVADLVVLHVSMLQYEFGEVRWKDRDVARPVMQLASSKS